MTALSQHQSLEYVKMLYMGNPGSGKTGSLTGLVAAGYKLRIWDFDNLLGSLVQYVGHVCPEKIGNVSFQTFTDKMKGLDTPVVFAGKSVKVMPFVDGTPDAYVRALKQLNHWKSGDEDLGKPGDWGSDTVIVIDSLTNAAAAAFRYAQAMNPAAMDQQTYYNTAQQLVMNMITLLFSEQVRCNVIVLAHLDYRENEFEVIKGFPRAIGRALNNQIGAYFNVVCLAEASGSGNNVKRVIRTNSTGIVDLKNPVSFKIPDSLPLETGLATIFKTITNRTPE